MCSQKKKPVFNWCIELARIREICLSTLEIWRRYRNHCGITQFCLSADSQQTHKMFPGWFISLLC